MFGSKAKKGFFRGTIYFGELIGQKAERPV